MVTCVAAGLLLSSWAGQLPPTDGASPRPSVEEADTVTGDSAAQPAEASDALAFSTRYAHFEPARWNDLPGWREDNLRDAWQAFRKTCAVLGTKPGWERPCARSAAVSGDSNDGVRSFFEREFALYQIRNTDRSPAGTITGYYEPLLSGSRKYGQYVWPSLRLSGVWHT